MTGSGGLIVSNVGPVVRGTLAVGAGSRVESKTTWDNLGTVLLADGFLTGSGIITNTATGQIRGAGAISNTVVNAGGITATNGELRLAYPVRGAGSYAAKNGATLTFVNGGSVSSLANAASTLRLEGVLTNTAAFANQGTLALAGGTYYSLATLSNPSGATVTGHGTVAALLENAGTVEVTGAGLTFSQNVTNSGTINLGASTAIFEAALTLAPTGVLVADSGSQLYLRGDFQNNSADNTGFDLLPAAVFFDGGGSHTQLFTLAGANLGATADGFTNNFAIGSLTIGGSVGTVKLTGASPASNALYVEELTVTAGSELFLDGFTIYTWQTNIYGAVYTGSGGAVVLIPEPSALVLAGAGVVLAMVLLRRRR